jgi:hypothetical protein
MRRTVLKRLKWQSSTRFLAALLAAAASIAAMAMASGCGPNDVAIHDCPDAGKPDGGDGGNAGGAGGGSLCD